jgi:propionate catabolism operon transcriptional regulator
MLSSNAILFVATNDELANIAREVASGNEDTMKVEIVMGNPMNALEIAHDADRQGFGAIVSRGTTSRIMSGAGMSIPVIQVKVTGYDAVRALLAAKRHANHVGIVGSDDMIRWMDGLGGLLGMEVSTRFAESWEEIGLAIRSLREKGVGAIVGWNLVQRRAAEMGLPFVPLTSGREAVHDALAEARSVLNARWRETERAERLKAILSSVTNAVVAVDSDGAITHFNQTAEGMVGISSEQAIGRHISTILKSEQIDGLRVDSESKGEWVEKLGSLTVLARSEPIVVDNRVVGAVFSLDDVTQIRELERIVREEVRDTGHMSKHRLSDIVGASSAMAEAVELAERFAKVDSTVLIEGETGTGKELFAHGIHSASARRDGPFVAVNCAAIPETLLESELFGYAPGAFTGARRSGKPGLFEVAHRGTMFLDEIGEMSGPLQARLLRVLQERETMRVGGVKVIPIDVRVIAATNKDLFGLVQREGFRDDLFYRLSVLNLQIPPLRERPEDIPLLAGHLMRSVAARLQRQPRRFSSGALTVLEDYSWPGNVRQLENTIEQLVAVGEERQSVARTEVDRILARYAASRERSPQKGNKPTATNAAVARTSARAADGALADSNLRQIETETILRTLEEAEGNKAETARRLGISKTTLWRRLKQIDAEG